MKKFLSTILAVVMVLSSMAMVVSANDADYAEGYYYVNGDQYTDFMAAVSAANGGTVIVSGECAFGSRLAVNSSVTLQGVNNATIVPSASYGSTDSTTNWKGLLNIAGENVIVNDITFDGSLYGDNQAVTVDFKPVRVTSGTTTLNNVTIKGSKRTLLMVGTSSSSADVVATNLTIGAVEKTLVDGIAYADIEVTGSESSFTCGSGSLGGYILGPIDSLSVTEDGYYKLVYSTENKEIYTTPYTLASGYVNNASAISSLDVRKYSSILTNENSETSDMVNDIVADIDNKADLAETFVDMIDDMLSRKILFVNAITGDARTTLTSYKTQLSTALGN